LVYSILFYSIFFISLATMSEFGNGCTTAH
jgi:hypothetical protein